MLQTAILSAKESGKFLLENLHKLDESKIKAKSARDFVTEIDKKSEKIIIEVIKSKFSNHEIIAEESGFQKSQSDYRWIIDPLDGTTNYIHKYPLFSVSIALQYKKDTVLGVVFVPYLNELFVAEKGKGAFLNNNPIKIAQHKNLKTTMLVTGFPFRNVGKFDLYMKIFKDLFLSCSGIRRDGSAALDLCYTACGRFDGFWEFGLSAWDIAAGDIILQQAGGKSSDFFGKNDYLASGNIVAANPVLHRQILEIIQKHV